ncbi:helix-turn-helix domain-containing protein [Streptomyces vinaceus]|uniref:helix-turn-helix domain-containing protein n=1 Tax=Streptomyces vinaceus TaxID=1960 RepID=UPI0037F558DC
MSKRSFARRFTAATGTTPHAWLRSLRLSRAEELLETTGLPVEEIARQVGCGARCGRSFQGAAGRTARFRAPMDSNQAGSGRQCRLDGGLGVDPCGGEDGYGAVPGADE